MMFSQRGAHRACHAPASPNGSAGGGACAEPAALLDEASLGRLRELDPQGTNQLLARVVAAFESSLLRLLPQLAQAERAGDLTTVHRVAHTLKSSASYVGALAMASQCAAIEAMVRDERTAGLDARVAELLAEAQAVRAALRSLPEHAR